VSYTEEEEAAESHGTGGAAMVAASAAYAREEGRRLDAIVDRGIRALEAAVGTYEKICNALLKERQSDAAVQRALLESVRTHYVAAAEAEADAVRIQAQADADVAQAQADRAGGTGGIEAIIAQALAGHLAAGAEKSTDEPPNGDRRRTPPA
jgi:hypothetical protein